MPGWGPVLGAEGVEQVMAYVLTLSGRHATGDLGAPQAIEAGKVRFTTMCTACHGADGRGIPEALRERRDAPLKPT